jgi:hypothetical protein
VIMHACLHFGQLCFLLFVTSVLNFTCTSGLASFSSHKSYFLVKNLLIFLDCLQVPLYLARSLHLLLVGLGQHSHRLIYLVHQHQGRHRLCSAVNHLVPHLQLLGLNLRFHSVLQELQLLLPHQRLLFKTQLHCFAPHHYLEHVLLHLPSVLRQAQHLVCVVAIYGELVVPCVFFFNVLKYSLRMSIL